MSSTNRELPPPPTPPKPRASPLDFRNTDLVSRLLAATPPYLYNMPMVPNSYFFSEMLRSFVQAKTENNNRASSSMAPVHRRPRKRSWTQARSEFYQKDSPPKMEKLEAPPTPPIWHKNLHALNDKSAMYYDNKITEIPLELTIDKPSMITSNSSKLNDMNFMKPSTPNLSYPTDSNPEKPHGSNQIPSSMMFPTIPQNLDTNNQNIILPPPPPIWYPPLYSAPYGIDPLHFFIDLRVSGHIYDRKNNANKDAPIGGPLMQLPQEIKPTAEEPVEVEAISRPIPHFETGGFKQSRHASAFSVPTHPAIISKNTPMNLSSNKETKTKFDVKSMGFEKSCNKTGTNYVMNNIEHIYKDLHVRNEFSYKIEPDEASKLEHVERNDEGDEREETEEERAKRVKDLRALIGLELVVDYMNHGGKPLQQPTGQSSHISDESISDNDSARLTGSPPLEVVDYHDEVTHVNYLN